MEKDLIESLSPLHITEDEETTALGHRGVWANKAEVQNWRGPVPISDYKLNEDASPDLITKTIHQPVEYTQDISVRYLKPPTPPPHGDLVIRQENDIVRPVAPPQIIRQLAPRPRTPEVTIPRKSFSFFFSQRFLLYNNSFLSKAISHKRKTTPSTTCSSSSTHFVAWQSTRSTTTKSYCRKNGHVSIFLFDLIKYVFNEKKELFFNI